MKLRRIVIENVRSFLEREIVTFPGDISILVGPNGGGKTNLLDIVVSAVRASLLPSWLARPSGTGRRDWSQNENFTPAVAPERHSGGQARDSVIELEIEVTAADLENIARTVADASTLHEVSEAGYNNHPLRDAGTWDISALSAGQRITCTIRNWALESIEGVAATVFRNYLMTYEVGAQLRADAGQAPLSMPMLFLPVGRTGATGSTAVTLADFDEPNAKRSVDTTTSRSGGAAIVSLAIGRLALRYRNLLEDDRGTAAAVSMGDPGTKKLVEALRALGFEWSFSCSDTRRNVYQVVLKKDGAEFRLDSASSGQRELLGYLFAIYALNVRDALIVIDEPELHLHPRWQKTLLGMFEQLANDTRNQFVMATHSPVFIAPSSIEYVSRVHSDGRSSRVVRLSDSSMPTTAKQFNIVNSQSNERIFFADRVVLVEGLHDRIFFEAVFRHFCVGTGTGRAYEVVDVGGKGLFAAYQTLLRACRVPYLTIADLDYVRETGSDELKGMFTVAERAIKTDVFDNDKSVDARSLVDRIDEAVRSGNTEDLTRLWEYIKGRQARLSPALGDEERARLDDFIAEKRRAERLYILRNGRLEDYLPTGVRSKDTASLITLTSDPQFFSQLPPSGTAELTEIANAVGGEWPVERTAPAG